jgi:hypothetical protein
MDSGSKPRYEIRLRGHLGPTTLGAFIGLEGRHDEHDTVLAGELPDQAALFGVLDQLQALGLELLELRRLSGDGSQR